MDGRLLTWLGTVPSISLPQFQAFDATLQANHGITRLGNPDFQSGGGVTAASALYTAALVQAMVRNNAGTLTLYLNMLWYGTPNIALLKADVQSAFSFTNPTIIENSVRF